MQLKAFGSSAISQISFTYNETSVPIVDLTISSLTYPNAYVGYILFEEVTPCLFERYISQKFLSFIK